MKITFVPVAVGFLGEISKNSDNWLSEVERQDFPDTWYAEIGLDATKNPGKRLAVTGTLMKVTGVKKKLIKWNKITFWGRLFIIS